MKTAQLDGRIGWIGTGRMGAALVRRLLAARVDLAVYNRTPAKAAPFAALGATVAEKLTDLADRDVVFTMVTDPAALAAVTYEPGGVLDGDGAAPGILVDCSTVSADASVAVRRRADERGTSMLAAPVSGNPRVVEAGKLSVAASGPRATFDAVAPYLAQLGSGVTYVGDGEAARLVKICHNIILGVVTQSLAEITVLAEKGGVSRHALLDFLNNSVMGSVFTRYKTSAFVNLDFRPTFTPPLLRKDFDLGLDAARQHGVPMPVAALVGEIVQGVVGAGHLDDDFAVLLVEQARAAGLELVSEAVAVDDGLG